MSWRQVVEKRHDEHASLLAFPIERLREIMDEACLRQYAGLRRVYLYPLDQVQFEAHLTPLQEAVRWTFQVVEPTAQSRQGEAAHSSA